VEGSSWSWDSADSRQGVSAVGATAGMEGLKGTMKGRSHRHTLEGAFVSLSNQQIVCVFVELNLLDRSFSSFLRSLLCLYL
jgi:hypothetical protein